LPPSQTCIPLLAPSSSTNALWGAQRSRHDAPVLRSLMALYGTRETRRMFVAALAKTLNRIRLSSTFTSSSNRTCEASRPNPEANVARPHLLTPWKSCSTCSANLEGVQDRDETPFFRPPQEIRARSIGTFPVSPRSRAANPWLFSRTGSRRQWATFYAPNLSSRKARHHGGPRQPARTHGLLKKRGRNKAASAFGCDHVRLRQPRTSTSNKMAVQGIARAR